MNALLLAIHKDKKFVLVHNMTITESQGEWVKTQKFDSNELLASFINNSFSIPKEIILECVQGLRMDKDIWN